MQNFTHPLENSKGDLQRLMDTVLDNRSRKQDYIADTNMTQVETVELDDGSRRTDMILEGDHGSPTARLAINGVAFDQMNKKAAIEVRTGRRLQQDYPLEFDAILNAIHGKENKSVTLRTFAKPRLPSWPPQSGPSTTGELRAVVSSRFKTFDNEDLLEGALVPLAESDAQWEVVHAQVTDRRMYARFKSRTIVGEAALGDVMAHGLGIENSEVGEGSVSLSDIIWTLACLNGQQRPNKFRAAHLTSSRSDSDTWALLTDETKDLDNAVLKAKIRDIATAFSSAESFEATLEKMRNASTDLVQGEAAKAVGRLGIVLKLSKPETSSVLEGLFKTLGQPGYVNRPLSRAHMVNAVTRAAHDADPDDVTAWQLRGTEVLELPRGPWNLVAKAPDSIAA